LINCGFPTVVEHYGELSTESSVHQDGLEDVSQASYIGVCQTFPNHLGVRCDQLRNLSYLEFESNILLYRKFFGKPMGSAPPPRQSKLAFSTKSSNGTKSLRPVPDSGKTESDIEDGKEDVEEDVEEDAVKKEEEGDGDDDTNMKQEPTSSNGHRNAP
jgi:hypothetical protein